MGTRVPMSRVRSAGPEVTNEGRVGGPGWGWGICGLGDRELFGDVDLAGIWLVW